MNLTASSVSLSIFRIFKLPLIEPAADSMFMAVVEERAAMPEHHSTNH